MLKILYTVFIGIMVSLFVGLGIAAFYPAPEQPNFSEPHYAPRAVDEKPTEEQRAEQERYDREYEEYRQHSEAYNRNVALIAVVISVLILALSLTIAHNIPVISDGLLLGGVLTLLYGTGRSFGTGDERIMFAFVAVGLVVAIAIGYLKFVSKRQ